MTRVNYQWLEFRRPRKVHWGPQRMTHAWGKIRLSPYVSHHIPKNDHLGGNSPFSEAPKLETHFPMNSCTWLLVPCCMLNDKDLAATSLTGIMVYVREIILKMAEPCRLVKYYNLPSPVNIPFILFHFQFLMVKSEGPPAPWQVVAAL